MKSITVFFSWIAILCLIFTACESKPDRIVSGDFFDRNSGRFDSINAHIDTIIPHQDKLGEAIYTLAGQYRGVSAFSVLKFNKPSMSMIDSLKSVIIKVDIAESWANEGDTYYLYETISDWNDSTRLEPDDFMLDDPISEYVIQAVADTTDTTGIVTDVDFGSLEFELEQEAMNNIHSWEEKGSFLIKQADDSSGMLLLSSRYSSHKPLIQYVSHNTTGSIDTTVVNCVDSNYFIDNDITLDDNLTPFQSIVSDGNAQSFVFKISLPDSLEETSAINYSNMKLNIHNPLVSGEAFEIGIYQLTDSLTTATTNASYVESTFMEHLITEETEYIDIDITPFITSWHTDKQPNYGLLIKPTSMSTSPDHAVISLEDSLAIFYSSLPEVE